MAKTKPLILECSLISLKRPRLNKFHACDPVIQTQMCLTGYWKIHERKTCIELQ